MNDNLDILKQQWQQLSARTQNLEQANRRLAERLAKSRTSSLQERLAARIGRIGWFGLILPILAPLLYYELMMPWWVALIYALFGLAMSIISFFLSEYVRAERLAELPVAEAITRAMKIKERQQQTRYIGIVLGISIVALMAFMLPEGPEREPIIIGGGIGLMIGLAFGINRCIVNARLAREIVKSLKS